MHGIKVHVPTGSSSAAARTEAQYLLGEARPWAFPNAGEEASFIVTPLLACVITVPTTRQRRRATANNALPLSHIRNAFLALRGICRGRVPTRPVITKMSLLHASSYKTVTAPEAAEIR